MTPAGQVHLRGLPCAPFLYDSTVLLFKDSTVTVLREGHHRPEHLLSHHLPPQSKAFKHWTKVAGLFFVVSINSCPLIAYWTSWASTVRKRSTREHHSRGLEHFSGHESISVKQQLLSFKR